ncbi:MAG: DUF4124 domain-containing protein [Gammaproteobacteria bacterium]
MKRLVGAALCAAIIGAPALAQDVYRWVDENGVVHYSDSPREGAEKVEVREPETYSAQSALPATPTARDSSVKVPPDAVDAYQSVRIATPAHDSVAWNTAGEIAVSVAVSPPLNASAGHKVLVYLDGAPVAGTPVASTSIGLTGIHRGTYQLSAAIVDGGGRQILRSETITFHVRQTSIQNPQRRP